MTTPPSKSESPSVGVIVISYNSGERIINTIRHLTGQPYPLAKIIVIDNGSTDGMPEQIEIDFPHVIVHRLGENLGPTTSRNRGVAMLDTDLVLLIDNDVYVEEHTVARMVAAHVETGAAVVCPRIQLIPERDHVQAEGADVHFVGTIRLRHGWQKVDGLPTTRQHVDGCISACLLVERDAYQTAGGFDELYFFYYEDLEFSVRMRSLGYDFVAEPSAVVFHDRGHGIVGLSYRGHEKKYPKRRGYLSLRNRLLMMFSHYRLRTLVMLTPALLMYECANVGMALMKGFGWQWVRAWGWQFGHLGEIIKRRKRMQRERKRGDRDIISGGDIPFSPGMIPPGIATTIVAVITWIMNVNYKIARRLMN